MSASKSPDGSKDVVVDAASEVVVAPIAFVVVVTAGVVVAAAEVVVSPAGVVVAPTGVVVAAAVVEVVVGLGTSATRTTTTHVKGVVPPNWMKTLLSEDTQTPLLGTFRLKMPDALIDHVAVVPMKETDSENEIQGWEKSASTYSSPTLRYPSGSRLKTLASDLSDVRMASPLTEILR